VAATGELIDSRNCCALSYARYVRSKSKFPWWAHSLRYSFRSKRRLRSPGFRISAKKEDHPYVEVEPRLNIPFAGVVHGMPVPVSTERIERALLPVLAVARLEPVDAVFGKRFTDQIEQLTYSFAKALGHYSPPLN
jgi:hypothetical protein